MTMRIMNLFKSYCTFIGAFNAKDYKASDLQIGMYVLLSDEWFKHSFLKNQFKIKSEKQIKKIIDCGIADVVIDMNKSSHHVSNTYTPKATDITPPVPEKSEPVKLIPDELKDIINDKNSPPRQKAKSVYKSSVDIMNRLLSSPTAQNIEEFKEGVTDVIDLILVDDETSNYLLNITSHDFYTYTHSVNVGVYSILLPKTLFKNTALQDMHELGAGFFLHDVGKVKVNSSIINKQGKLTDDEMEEMRTHPSQVNNILSEANQLSEECKVIVIQHHERNDGTGYPLGLTSDDIHLYACICSIADVYDALISKRTYRAKLDPFHALKLMKEEMITRFSKEIFDEFVLLFK